MVHFLNFGPNCSKGKYNFYVSNIIKKKKKKRDQVSSTLVFILKLPYFEVLTWSLIHRLKMCCDYRFTALHK